MVEIKIEHPISEGKIKKIEFKIIGIQIPTWRSFF